MCGIVGVFGQIGSKEEKTFKQLLEVDSLRGRHSTGVVKVDSNGIVSTKKKAVDGIDFVKLEGTWISQGTNRALIGHNRWATKGAVNDVNAHPFSHGHIHGVHNGTLTSQYGLKDYTKFDVDSDNIFYDIAHGSIEKTVENLRGAFAIALYDEKDKSINIFRNEQRELAMAVVNNGATVIIASEHLMLEWVLMRNDYCNKDGIPTYEMVEFIETFKKFKLSPLAKNKKSTGFKPVLNTLEQSVLQKPKLVAYMGGAKKPSKALKDYGLDGLTYYPMELVEEFKPKTARKNDSDTVFILRMLCAPFEETTITVYNTNSIERIRGLINDNDLLACRLNIPHVPRDTAFTTYAADVKIITEKELNMVEDEPAVKK